MAKGYVRDRKISKALRRARYRIMRAVAKLAVPGVKEVALDQCPVRTGKLRKSLKVRTRRTKVVLRSKLRYATYQYDRVFEHEELYRPIFDAAVEQVSKDDVV